MDLLNHLKMSLPNFSFAMIYIIHKLLVWLKNKLSYLYNSIFKCFFKAYNILSFKKIIFSITYNNGRLKS